eukprot:XP_013976846.1 collagen alpha-1(III) chain-like [Canis lupus familiaris]
MIQAAWRSDPPRSSWPRPTAHLSRPLRPRAGVAGAGHTRGGGDQPQKQGLCGLLTEHTVLRKENGRGPVLGGHGPGPRTPDPGPRTPDPPGVPSTHATAGRPGPRGDSPGGGARHGERTWTSERPSRAAQRPPSRGPGPAAVEAAAGSGRLGGGESEPRASGPRARVAAGHRHGLPPQAAALVPAPGQQGQRQGPFPGAPPRDERGRQEAPGSPVQAPASPAGPRGCGSADLGGGPTPAPGNGGKLRADGARARPRGPTHGSRTITAAPETRLAPHMPPEVTHTPSNITHTRGGSHPYATGSHTPADIIHIPWVSTHPYATGSHPHVTGSYLHATGSHPYTTGSYPYVTRSHLNVTRSHAYVTEVTHTPPEVTHTSLEVTYTPPEVTHAAGLCPRPPSLNRYFIKIRGSQEEPGRSSSRRGGPAPESDSVHQSRTPRSPGLHRAPRPPAVVPTPAARSPPGPPRGSSRHQPSGLSPARAPPPAPATSRRPVRQRAPPGSPRCSEQHGPPGGHRGGTAGRGAGPAMQTPRAPLHKLRLLGRPRGALPGSHTRAPPPAEAPPGPQQRPVKSATQTDSRGPGASADLSTPAWVPPLPTEPEVGGGGGGRGSRGRGRPHPSPQERRHGPGCGRGRSPPKWPLALGAPAGCAMGPGASAVGRPTGDPRPRPHGRQAGGTPCALAREGTDACPGRIPGSGPWVTDRWCLRRLPPATGGAPATGCGTRALQGPPGFPRGPSGQPRPESGATLGQGGQGTCWARGSQSASEAPGQQVPGLAARRRPARFPSPWHGPAARSPPLRSRRGLGEWEARRGLHLSAGSAKAQAAWASGKLAVTPGHTCCGGCARRPLRLFQSKEGIFYGVTVTRHIINLEEAAGIGPGLRASAPFGSPRKHVCAEAAGGLGRRWEDAPAVGRRGAWSAGPRPARLRCSSEPRGTPARSPAPRGASPRGEGVQRDYRDPGAGRKKGNRRLGPTVELEAGKSFPLADLWGGSPGRAVVAGGGRCGAGGGVGGCGEGGAGGGGRLSAPCSGEPFPDLQGPAQKGRPSKGRGSHPEKGCEGLQGLQLRVCRLKPGAAELDAASRANRPQVRPEAFCAIASCPGLPPSPPELPCAQARGEGQSKQTGPRALPPSREPHPGRAEHPPRAGGRWRGPRRGRGSRRDKAPGSQQVPRATPGLLPPHRPFSALGGTSLASRIRAGNPKGRNDPSNRDQAGG